MRCRHLLALAATAGGLILASPAAPAAGAAVPSGSDFTQPVPESVQLREASPQARRIADRRNGYGLEGPVLYRSDPIEAPRRFDLVGIADSMHAFEYRARRDGKPWSEWMEADNGDPVYTGGTDRLQIRSRGVPIAGQLHYVRVDDGTTPAGRLLARGGGGGSQQERSMAHGRRLPPEPKFITRAQWGANSRKSGCLPRTDPEIGRVKAAVIHHTVNLNDYTETEAPSIVLGICRYHRNANGWNDIGYNALVDRFGNLYEGRAGGLSRAIVGAQAEGVNSQTTGIASIGDHREVGAPAKERKSIARYVAWKFGLNRIPANGRTRLLSSGGSTQRTPFGQRVQVPRIFSHNTTNFTACAGDRLIAQIPSIRRQVKRKLGSSLSRGSSKRR